MTNYIITGAGSYLGREIASHLAKSPGNRILLVTRSNASFANILSDDVTHIAGIDLLKERDLERMVTTAQYFFESGFNVINCVGYFEGQSPFEQVSFAEAGRILDSNFRTVHNTATALIPLMVSKGGGHFIGFSCNSVRFNYPQMAPFTSAKAALESLIKCLANEFYGRGIYANALQLATLRTEKEIAVKPHGDHTNWLVPSEVARFIEMFTQQPIQLYSGNVMSLYNYSESFFGQSYYDRIKK